MGGLGLQLVIPIEQCFDSTAKLALVLALPCSASTGVVDQFDIAEVVGGFALPCTAVVIGALVATAFGAVGKGDLMATLVVIKGSRGHIWTRISLQALLTIS